MLQKADVAEVLAAEGRRGLVRRITQVAAIVALIAVGIGLAVWLWIGVRSAGASGYATDLATIGSITETLVATGTLQPVEEVQVASLTTGTVSSVEVEYNQAVHAGQVLARIDATALEAQLKHAMAAVDVQSANRDTAHELVVDAQAALKRVQELTTGTSVTQRDVDLATTALARMKAGLVAAEAQLAMAKADLSVAQKGLSNATITSPIDGIVLDISAKVGQTITATSAISPLFVVATNLRDLHLEVDIDEADVARVKVGDRAKFTVESAPDREIAGDVEQLRSGPTVSDGVTSYIAIVGVHNADLSLKPGMTATAEIATAEAHDVLTVPNSALRFVPTANRGGLLGIGAGPAVEQPPVNQEHVYVVRGNVLQLVVVNAGISDGIRTVITSGALQPGDVVATGAKAR